MSILNSFYTSLNKIRDEFHKYGSFNDSNSKLDELTKLISIYLFDYKENTKPLVSDLIFKYQFDKNYPLVRYLKSKFNQVIQSKSFQSTDGKSIFHDDYELKIDDNDNEFAFKLLCLIYDTLEKLNEKTDRFDFINETFGHFVRDNFRNNLEDAQYMTPIEVVELMNDIAIKNIENGELKLNGDFVVCDPSCGVGSFLTEFYQRNKRSNFISPSKLRLVGQDKVPRMVRLTSLNLMLFDSKYNFVFSGNSLIGNSRLDDFENKVDLILTNPPFGAKFGKQELLNEKRQKFPMLSDLFANSNSINSEILFLDRCISLLKNGGEILAVVPDSVISSHGIADTLRYRIINSENIIVKSIIELPVETFAQAGTRTKTSILHLKKIEKKESNTIFIAKSDCIGFDVSTRKGATIKVAKGINDLPEISNTYNKIFHIKNFNDFKILNNNPSVSLIKSEYLRDNSWTPNHYSTQRLNIINNLNKNNTNFDLVPLRDLVSFITKNRKKERIPENARHISVLHIFNGDVVDYEDMLQFKPKYPGITCYPGDIIFSKINPRIPRILVIPDFDFPLACSNEFEIMTSITKITNYGIKLLLMLPMVQTQIISLTSGTSSSHNRIKTKELENILIPIPNENSDLYEPFMLKIIEYENKIRTFNQLNVERLKIKESISMSLNL